MTATKETFLSSVLSILRGETEYACFGTTKIVAHDGYEIIEGLPTMTRVGNKIELGMVGSFLSFHVVDITEDQVSVISEISREFKRAGVDTNNC